MGMVTIFSSRDRKSVSFVKIAFISIASILPLANPASGSIELVESGNRELMQKYESAGNLGFASANLLLQTPSQPSRRLTLLWVMLLPLLAMLAIWLVLEKLEERAHRQTEEVDGKTANALSEIGLLVNQTKMALEDVQTYLDRPQFPLETASDYCQHGNCLFQAGEYDEAIAAYDRAIELHPEFYQAWNNRGSTCFRLKRYYEAIENFDRALSLKPDYAQAQQNRELALLASDSSTRELG
jgi:tetratricopeptide (TPR) repeat protein